MDFSFYLNYFRFYIILFTYVCKDLWMLDYADYLCLVYTYCYIWRKNHRPSDLSRIDRSHRAGDACSGEYSAGSHAYQGAGHFDGRLHGRFRVSRHHRRPDFAAGDQTVPQGSDGPVWRQTWPWADGCGHGWSSNGWSRALGYSDGTTSCWQAWWVIVKDFYRRLLYRYMKCYYRSKGSNYS